MYHKPAPILQAMLLWLGSLPCSGCSKRAQHQEEPALKLVLEKLQSANDQQQLARLSVTNRGSKPVTWDKQFAVFLFWVGRYEDTTAAKTSFESVKRHLSDQEI